VSDMTDDWSPELADELPERDDLEWEEWIDINSIAAWGLFRCGDQTMVEAMVDGNDCNAPGLTTASAWSGRTIIACCPLRELPERRQEFVNEAYGRERHRRAASAPVVETPV